VVIRVLAGISRRSRSVRRLSTTREGDWLKGAENSAPRLSTRNTVDDPENRATRTTRAAFTSLWERRGVGGALRR